MSSALGPNQQDATLLHMPPPPHFSVMHGQHDYALHRPHPVPFYPPAAGLHDASLLQMPPSPRFSATADHRYNAAAGFSHDGSLFPPCTPLSPRFSASAGAPQLQHDNLTHRPASPRVPHTAVQYNPFPLRNSMPPSSRSSTTAGHRAAPHEPPAQPAQQQQQFRHEFTAAHSPQQQWLFRFVLPPLYTPRPLHNTPAACMSEHLGLAHDDAPHTATARAGPSRSSYGTVNTIDTLRECRGALSSLHDSFDAVPLMLHSSESMVLDEQRTGSGCPAEQDGAFQALDNCTMPRSSGGPQQRERVCLPSLKGAGEHAGVPGSASVLKSASSGAKERQRDCLLSFDSAEGASQHAGEPGSVSRGAQQCRRDRLCARETELVASGSGSREIGCSRGIDAPRERGRLSTSHLRSGALPVLPSSRLLPSAGLRAHGIGNCVDASQFERARVLSHELATQNDTPQGGVCEREGVRDNVCVMLCARSRSCDPQRLESDRHAHAKPSSRAQRRIKTRNDPSTSTAAVVTTASLCAETCGQQVRASLPALHTSTMPSAPTAELCTNTEPTLQVRTSAAASAALCTSTAMSLHPHSRDLSTTNGSARAGRAAGRQQLHSRSRSPSATNGSARTGKATGGWQLWSTAGRQLRRRSRSVSVKHELQDESDSDGDWAGNWLARLKHESTQEYQRRCRCVWKYLLTSLELNFFEVSVH